MTPERSFCPLCWGQGAIYERFDGDGPLMPVLCDACRGTGYVDNDKGDGNADVQREDEPPRHDH